MTRRSTRATRRAVRAMKEAELHHRGPLIAEPRFVIRENLDLVADVIAAKARQRIIENRAEARIVEGCRG